MAISILVTSGKSTSSESNSFESEGTAPAKIATMFAFGLPVRTVTRMSMLENLITGVLGTLLGIGLGYVVLVWLMTERMATQLRTITFNITLSPLTLGMAVGIGVIVVALTPLLNMRKMLRMDIPSTLRVME